MNKKNRKKNNENIITMSELRETITDIQEKAHRTNEMFAYIRDFKDFAKVIMRNLTEIQTELDNIASLLNDVYMEN